jgi:hypothetical protein
MVQKKQPKLIIAYENRLDNFLDGGKEINDIRGKYFQNIYNPRLIVKIPTEKELEGIPKGVCGLPILYPLLFGRWGGVSSLSFYEYASISEEQFKEYQDKKINLSTVVLKHKDAQIFKENKEKN